MAVCQRIEIGVGSGVVDLPGRSDETVQRGVEHQKVQVLRAKDLDEVMSSQGFRTQHRGDSFPGPEPNQAAAGNTCGMEDPSEPAKSCPRFANCPVHLIAIADISLQHQDLRAQQLELLNCTDPLHYPILLAELFRQLTPAVAFGQPSPVE